MVVTYRERNCAENFPKLHNKIISKNLHLTCNHNSYRVLFDKNCC